MTVPVFYFDLGSPYAYLAAERVGRLFAPAPRWQPVLLGALMMRFGTTSWALGPERARGIAECERRAATYGLPPLRWPDPWPSNYLFAMRVATHAQRCGRADAFARTAFRLAFVAGKDLAERTNVLRAAASCGLDSDEAARNAERPEIKQALRSATEHAGNQGVHGVPTVGFAGVLYFGDDRLETAAAAVRASVSRS